MKNLKRRKRRQPKIKRRRTGRRKAMKKRIRKMRKYRRKRYVDNLWKNRQQYAFFNLNDNESTPFNNLYYPVEIHLYPTCDYANPNSIPSQKLLQNPITLTNCARKYTNFKVSGFSYKITYRDMVQLGDGNLASAPGVSAFTNQIFWQNEPILYRITANNPFDNLTSSSLQPTIQMAYCGPWGFLSEFYNTYSGCDVDFYSTMGFKRLNPPKKGQYATTSGYVSLKNFYVEQSIQQWYNCVAPVGSQSNINPLLSVSGNNWPQECMNMTSGTFPVTTRLMPHLEIIIPQSFMKAYLNVSSSSKIPIEQSMLAMLNSMISFETTTYVKFKTLRNNVQ